jgi:hypothetical protein
MREAGPNALLSGAALAASLLAISLLASCGGGSNTTVPPGAGSAGTGTEGAAVPASIRSFGDQASPADRAAAATVVQEFQRARANGEWAKACSLMAPSLVHNLRLFVSTAPQLKNRGCPELVQAVTATISAKRLPSAGRIQVTGVRTADGHGFVFYRDVRGSRWALPVARDDSAWKVAALVGPRLP